MHGKQGGVAIALAAATAADGAATTAATIAVATAAANAAVIGGKKSGQAGKMQVGEVDVDAAIRHGEAGDAAGQVQAHGGRVGHAKADGVRGARHKQRHVEDDAAVGRGGGQLHQRRGGHVALQDDSHREDGARGRHRRRNAGELHRDLQQRVRQPRRAADAEERVVEGREASGGHGGAPGGRVDGESGAQGELGGSVGQDGGVDEEGGSSLDAAEDERVGVELHDRREAGDDLEAAVG